MFSYSFPILSPYGKSENAVLDSFMQNECIKGIEVFNQWYLMEIA
jgi:hypothetical protein